MPRQTIGGRYELEQPLGGGSMSAVWLAHDRELERKVAVKLLAPHADRARFEREAHAVASLSHPNIVQLFDYGEAEQGPYIVLEYMSGGTLEDRLAGGRRLADDDVMRIAQEVASGLAHAHERGLVHRDLKPANILFDSEGRAKVADFGIARIEGGNELTVAGTVLGTAAYLSPEQASGQPTTPASDVYSLGVMLFRMLTGRAPFVSDNPMELVRMHQQDPAPRVEELRDDAPPALAALTSAALAKDPAERPRDGSAVLGALTGMGTELGAEDAAATRIISAPLFDGSPTQMIPRARPPRRTGRPRLALPVAIAAAAVLAAIGAAAAFLLTAGGGSSSPPTTPSVSLPPAARRSTASSSSSTTTTTASSSSSTTSSTTSAPTTPRTTTAPPLSTSITTAPLPAPTTAVAPPPATSTLPPTTTAPPPTSTTTTPVTSTVTTTGP